MQLSHSSVTDDALLSYLDGFMPLSLAARRVGQHAVSTPRAVPERVTDLVETARADDAVRKTGMGYIAAFVL